MNQLSWGSFFGVLIISGPVEGAMFRSQKKSVKIVYFVSYIDGNATMALRWSTKYGAGMYLFSLFAVYNSILISVLCAEKVSLFQNTLIFLRDHL